jgi:hypothetical protein
VKRAPGFRPRSFALRRALLLAAGLAVVGGAATLSAQRFGRRYEPAPEVTKLPYDGRFTFARIRFPLSPYAGNDIKWAHDYPRAERHFMEILKELTSLRPTTGGGTVLDLADPDLFKFPLAYLCEPGFWEPSEEDVVALRNYLKKGGFLIVDDFPARQWQPFEQILGRVLPGARAVPLDPKHPIFDSFYHIDDTDLQLGGYMAGQGQFLGVFEDDDPSKRLLMVINFNQDVGEFWEYSDEGLMPVDLSNAAYKLGVNYVVYAMTH